MISPLFQDIPTSEPVKIREPVRVAVDFDHTKIRPLAFVWRDRKYSVKRVSMVYKRQHGTGFWWCFAVADEANSFILLYDPIKMSWVLEEVYAL